MDFWFLSNPDRLNEERTAITQLHHNNSWLIGTEWTLSSDGLAINAAVKAHGITYNILMTYPNHFPFAPPIVRPANPSESWSSHQYRDGSLCLEWGPDTWISTVTGAQVLESVFRLLEIENPLGSETSVIAPSRHYLTMGQKLRKTIERIYIGNKLQQYVGSLPNLTSGTIRYSNQYQRDAYTLLIHEVSPLSFDEWKDAEIPNTLRNKRNVWFSQGLIFTTELKHSSITKLSTLSEMEEALKAAGYKDISLSWSESIPKYGLEKPPGVIIITDQDHVLHVFTSYKEDELWHTGNIIPDNNSNLPRTQVELQTLAEKRIGIIGLGSLGSKVAVSVARMGVKDFFLVDDDILMPENLCRHELDWNSVGEHKAAAVAKAIDSIVYDAKIEISKVNVTGQENPAVLNGVLDKLSQCDMILDMTASSQVFNIMSGVFRQNKVPLIWAEVFAGGIGGLIARSRPKKDPDPQVIRAAYLRYTEEHPFEEGVATTSYALENTEGHVIIASDADVNVIASNATNLAIDTVLDREPSTYPYSLYLIGLKRSWVFSQPFHNIPIDTKHLKETHIGSKQPTEQIKKDTVEFIGKLLEKKNDQNSSAE